MVNTCAVVGCKTNYKKRKQNVNFIPDKRPVFSFPVQKPELSELRKKWIKFVNRKDWLPDDYNYSGICAKHFEPQFLTIGAERTTLKRHLHPVPTIYGEDDESVPPSLLPTPSSTRKPPKQRTFMMNNEEEAFKNDDRIKSFQDLDSSLSPPGYKFDNFEGFATF